MKLLNSAILRSIVIGKAAAPNILQKKWLIIQLVLVNNVSCKRGTFWKSKRELVIESSSFMSQISTIKYRELITNLQCSLILLH